MEKEEVGWAIVVDVRRVVKRRAKVGSEGMIADGGLARMVVMLSQSRLLIR